MPERDAERTRRRILDALGEILSEEGFSRVGVNAVARRAGVDKVLIYRYFGGMDGLLADFASDRSVWPTNEELLGEDPESAELADLLVTVLRNHLKEIRSRPLTQAIMRWELHERNALTEAMGEVRERRGLELLEVLSIDRSRWPELDVVALAALVHAGLTYLTLRAKTTDHYAGIDLTSEEGFERLEAAIEPLIRGALNHGEAS